MNLPFKEICHPGCPAHQKLKCVLNLLWLLLQHTNMDGCVCAYLTEACLSHFCVVGSVQSVADLFQITLRFLSCLTLTMHVEQFLS